jgi:lipoprotein NlpI
LSIKLCVDLTQALAIQPNNATALTYRSSVFTKMQNFTEALEDLNKLVEVSPSYEILNSRGAIYNKTGNSRLALRDFTAGNALIGLKSKCFKHSS